MRLVHGDVEAHLMDDYYAPILVLLSSIPTMFLSKEPEENRFDNQILVPLPEQRLLTPRIPEYKLPNNRFALTLQGYGHYQIGEKCLLRISARTKLGDNLS